MKKILYLVIITFVTVLFSSCVKDELPAPQPAPPENYSDIVINELITKDITSPYFTDESGSNADWVELYNKGTKAVDIAGMYITDNPGTEDDYQKIPSDKGTVTTIPPKGFLVLIFGAADASGNDIPTGIANGKIFINTGLSSSKDHRVALYDPSKVQIDISDDFNGLEDDKSFGRSSDGADEWVVLASKTPGMPNDGSAPVEGTLVINEFMASNNTFYPGPNNDYPDWIEIYNTGETDIDLAGWYLTDKLDDIQKNQIPEGFPEKTVVPAHGFVVVICDGTGPESGPLFTNFKLSSSGESIGLSKDGVVFADSLTYGTGGDIDPGPVSDWSAGRDGDGAATWLLFDPDSDRPPTPGQSNNR